LPAGFAARHAFGQIKRRALFLRHRLQVALPAEFHRAEAAGETTTPLPHYFHQVAAIQALINFRGHRNSPFVLSRFNKPLKAGEGAAPG